VEQWRGLVSNHFPSNRVDQALHIMWCESRGDPEALNPFSGAAGLFQFIPSTWATASSKAGYGGADAFDPEANTATAAWLAQQYENAGQYYWQAWSCKRVLH
jgi:soluble lytic murein transglycosylase-like protein